MQLEIVHGVALRGPNAIDRRLQDRYVKLVREQTHSAQRFAAGLGGGWHCKPTLPITKRWKNRPFWVDLPVKG